MLKVAVCLFLLILGSSSPALATIKYFNNFKYDIHIAIAYETADGFVSEGWTGVKANSCWEDKDIVSPITFYYHAIITRRPTRFLPTTGRPPGIGATGEPFAS